MAQRQTHFEIFVRRAARADWALAEATPDRAHARARAQALYAERPQGAVRVDKVTFDPAAAAFHAVTILGLGDVADTPDRRAAGAAAGLPCTTPEDFYDVHARRVIARVLKTWLERELATPLELLHDPDLARRLEREGAAMQHAIQKTAIAQASEHGADVQHCVRRLNELTEKAFAALLERERRNRLPRIGAAGFAALVDRQGPGPGRDFALRAAVAGALKPAADWREKTQILLTLAEDADSAAAPGKALAAIDEFLADILVMPGAAEALVPGAACLGDLLEALVGVIGGQAGSAPTAPARMLAARFRARGLPAARRALIRRVLAELLRPQRLKPDEFWNEVRQLRRLADAMTAQAGPDLPPEDIAEAFIYRSGRLVRPEAVDEALAGAESAAAVIDRLIRLEQALAGASAKQKLAACLRARLGAHATVAELAHGPGRPLERAARIAGLQQAVLNGRLPAEERTEIAAMLDRICMEALSGTRVFETLAAGSGAPLERATALLQLATRSLTRGRASAEAGRHAQLLLRQAMRDGAAAAPERLTEIRALLAALAA